MAAGAGKAFSRITSHPGEAWDRLTGGKWDQYTTGTGPEGQYETLGPLGLIKRWGSNISDMIGSANPPRDTTFYPNQIKSGMHDVMDGLFNTVTPSQKQLLEGEPDLKFMNRDILNSQLTDQRKQLREGINPLDVLTEDDLKTFHGNMYGSQMQSSEALQRGAERLFAKRGVKEAAELARSDVYGKPLSQDLNVIDDKEYLGFMIDDIISGNYEDGVYTGTKARADAAKLEAARQKAEESVQTGGAFGSGGFKGFDKGSNPFAGMKFGD